MPLLNDVMKEALRLVEECPLISTATHTDEIYKSCSHSPSLPAADAEEGIWMTINKTLDNLFGSDTGIRNILKGPNGVALAIEWVNKGREHPSWDSAEEKNKRVNKKGKYDSQSDLLVKLKFEGIVEKVKFYSNTYVYLLALGGPIQSESQLAPSATTPSNSNGVKHRNDLNPDTDVDVVTEPPAPKRIQPAQTSNDAIIISSDDEEVELAKSNKDSKTVQKTSKGKLLSCHCGAAPVTLRRGQVEGAQAHWSSGVCKDATSGLRGNQMLTSFFKSDPALQPVNRNLVDTVCPGLTNETWIRPRATCTISHFLESTYSIFRGLLRHEVRRELFGNIVTEADLTASQKSQLIATLESRCTWVVKRTGERNTIHSKTCLEVFQRSRRDPVRPCKPCLEIKNCRSLIRALKHKYATGDDIKFTPEYLVVIDKYYQLVKKHKSLKTLHQSLASSTNGDFGDFLERLAIDARRGLFKNREVVRGLIMGCAVRAEREEAGKTLQGMRIDAHLYDCLTTLGAMSKSALKLVTKNFVGKTLRCQRLDRARSKTEIYDGMTQANFNRAGAILSELGYSGPVAVGSDQTVCVQTLRHHRGFIVGAQGGDIPFNNPKELQDLLEKIKKEKLLCSKIRAYTIQVPLPNIPTLVVALLASPSDEGAEQIAELHNNVIQMSSAAGINVLSIGADGAASELAAQAQFNQMATQFLSYLNTNLDVHIKVPLFGIPPRPVVTLQDPKHARKTGANQLLSGSRLITIGKYVVSLQDLSQVLQSSNSPLLTKDVFDCDKQDDGRALRTFCSQTVATTLSKPECVGLTVYLFIIGELCDAWLNKAIGVVSKSST
ncbi:uncharacterized protein MELLADRAFT_96196 [Melampsora larici-populina 98AG31]|uniref:Uncharacterized protein n=1 Tax=Melampsora larici-populina (strain 98AG31 / pathotype 3-4-7) TaxID=747676 RepID=F4SBB1_MELLP|nr:uncharacterized protein MELLADRAFT_96196 [Melampsora larici-populina 98AG31]EGF98071.1 hypothetical protein MELLADRAFT_96196 [Melampsora larici-populina 98AG31]